MCIVSGVKSRFEVAPGRPVSKQLFLAEKPNLVNYSLFSTKIRQSPQYLADAAW
jgi:hypothetical protein